MAKKKWKLVRLEEGTVARLQALVETWVRTEWEGLPVGERCQWTEHVSIDRIVTVLLDREEAHRSRSNRPRSNKAAPSPPSELE